MPAKRKSAANKENTTESPSKKVKPSKTDDENEDTTVLDDSNKPTTSAAASNTHLTPRRLRDLSNKFDTMATKTPPKREAKEANKALSVKEREKAFENLVEKLKSAEKSGDYSVEGEANELPTLLRLYVKDFGNVALPLVKRQAEELIKVCKPAPYGKNMDTLVDTNVRDSYQLDPEQIEIRNPEWNIKLKDLVLRVGKALGCKDKIEAKLYKVLIYKPGGHFVKHRDSEKDKKMFGTLIIQPPSTHTGGELVVYEANGKSKKVIDFGQKENKSKLSVQFAAHYADLEHELLEVKSGYRLALVYSLCWIRGNGHLTYYNNSSLANELSSILDKLNDQPYQLGLLMEHQYTAQSFQTNGFRALKGNDNDCYSLLSRANQLLEADKQLTMYICHASLFIEQYDVSGYDHPTGYIDPKYKHYEWDESDRDYKIAEWYDVNGKPVFNSSHFELDFFTKMFDMANKTSCQPVDLKNESEWGKYTRQEIGGYLGNESVTKTTTYNKYVLVIWPKRFEYEILINIDVNLVVDSVYKSIVINSLVDPLVMEQFQAVLKFVPPKKPTKKEKSGKEKEKQTKTLNGKAINEILEILLKLNDMKYLEEFFSQHKPLITPINCRLFVKLIVQFGYESIKHLLNLVVNPTVEDLIQNCHFIMALHEEKQTRPLALDYMKSCVIPLMNKPSELKKIIDYTRHESFGYKERYSWKTENYWRKNLDYEREEDILVEKNKQRHVLVIIAKTLHLFQDQQIVNDAFEALIEATLKSAKDDDGLELLFFDLSTEFQKENSALKKCTQIKNLFERRKASLEEKLKHKPPFSWSMPKAKIPEHPHVQAFLRGEDEQMTYSAPFKTAQEVRNFINDYNDCYGWGIYMREFSAKITEKPGKTVLIKKTKKVHEDRVRKYGFYESEIARIKSYFQSKPFV